MIISKNLLVFLMNSLNIFFRNQGEATKELTFWGVLQLILQNVLVNETE
jgi:hypothetical protein